MNNFIFCKTCLYSVLSLSPAFTRKGFFLGHVVEENHQSGHLHASESGCLKKMVTSWVVADCPLSVCQWRDGVAVIKADKLPSRSQSSMSPYASHVLQFASDENATRLPPMGSFKTNQSFFPECPYSTFLSCKTQTSGVKLSVLGTPPRVSAQILSATPSCLRDCTPSG
ncbi:hypothetical protein HJG60_008060 [Phyllostomus discolor]|uniref:Uncharacterized protein n=1 Tax=Phyllostomus discolor TaxID=89673 RepID=A0A834BI25_9CHIR|nr:hypothetical protein HJG60_008060 [Phyllostomus discolor]